MFNFQSTSNRSLRTLRVKRAITLYHFSKTADSKVMLMLANLLSPIFSTNGLILLFVLFVTAYVYMTRNFGYWKQRQVKEVPPWAFFGNFAQCLLMRKSPRSFMIDMYHAGKGERLIGYYVLDKPHIMVRDPELIKHVLIKDFQDFPNRHLSTTKADKLGHANIFTSRGPYWRATRQVMSRFFTSGKMRKAFERMPDVANDLDKYLLSNGVTDQYKAFNISEACIRFLMDLMGVTTFGMKFNCLTNLKADFREQGKIIFENSHKRHLNFLLVFFMPQFLEPFGIEFFPKRTSKFFLQVFSEVLNEKRMSSGSKIDFLDYVSEFDKKQVLLNNQAQEFEDYELIAQAGVFFAAGHSTTALTTALALYELAKKVDVQKKLREEIRTALEENNGKFTYDAISPLPYLEAVVSEVLRIHPAVTYIDRRAVNAYQFPGTNVTIDNDTPVSIPMMAIHMDPQYFPEPESFMPERFYGRNKENIHKYTYFPFGEGPHICIGQRLGLMLTKFAVSYMISKYEVELCDKTPVPMEYSTLSTFLNVKDDIKLKIRAIKC